MRLLTVLLFALIAGAAHAQTYQVVPTCGQATPPAGNVSGYMDQTGHVCVSGQVTIVGPDGPEGGVSVSINPFREDSTNFSGAITVGGSWQMVAPADPLRQRFFVQNQCSAQTQGIATTESIFLAVRATMPTTSPLVTTTGTELIACGAYDTSSAVISVSPVWLWAATTGHRFQALSW